MKNNNNQFVSIVRTDTCTGLIVKTNPFRFSTKYQDSETDLLYFGYRYYTPATGRWLSKDPIEEIGGLNLYCFIGNATINYLDAFGLMKWSDVVKVAAVMDKAIRKIKCCCDDVKSVQVFLTGTASGSTVTLTSDVRVKGKGDCPLSIVRYYWWDCFTAQKEMPPNVIVDWHRWGWYEGDSTQPAAHEGGHKIVPDRWGDSLHWDWKYVVIYITCGKDHHMHAYLSPSAPDLEYTWDSNSKSWGDPK